MFRCRSRHPPRRGPTPGAAGPGSDSDSTTADLTKPAYSVRLANDGIWDSETGVNDLGMQLTVE